jgi:DNA-binding transcriptional regulator YiaG
MMHHYIESGLDNVYLIDGVDFCETAYGRAVSIHDTEGLHKAIGLWIADAPKPINGAELRFLRLELELTQRDLAGILGAQEQTLRLWEKARGKPIPGPADRLLRAFYRETTTGDGSVKRMVERLASLDQQPATPIRLRETSSGWRVDATPRY